MHKASTSLWQPMLTSLLWCAEVGGTSCGANKLSNLVRKASSVVGMELDSVEAVTEKRLRLMLKAIMDNPSRQQLIIISQILHIYINKKLHCTCTFINRTLAYVHTLRSI